MSVAAAPAPPMQPIAARPQSLLFGGWEVGIIAFMLLLYAAGTLINPAFFGTTDAVSAILRDSARFGVMAVGMTFVIVNRELDLSVGSTLGLVAVAFSILFSPTNLGLDAWTAAGWCLLLGLVIGLLNGFVVTVLQVPAFIATLTMLFIGRGMVLGLTGGKTIAYDLKAREYPTFFALGETNAFGFNTQILIFLVVAVFGAIALARTPAGYRTYAVGGNEQAARYAGIATRFVRMRAYVFSALCATLAGLMNVAQNKGVDSQYGQGAELVVIAAVIVGGAAIAGGRGRVIGACLGTMLIVLIDKVLREGVPVTRIQEVAGIRLEVQALAQLPPGAVPAFLGLILLVAVILEPWIVRRQGPARLWAKLRGRVPPLPLEGGIAITGVQTRGGAMDARGMGARGLRAFFARRDAAAILLAAALWLAGFLLRPDFWGSLDNTFTLLLAFTEVALLAIGLTFVIAQGDIDLSVGSVMALSGATAAFLMKELMVDAGTAVAAAVAVGLLAGAINGWLTVRFGLPSFVATLGMFYIARGIGAWMVSGRQLSGFSESFNLIGRNLAEGLAGIGMAPPPGLFATLARAVSTQTLFMALVAIVAGIVLAKTPFGQKTYAVGGNERAAAYAGIDTKRVRFLNLMFSAGCAACAGVIYVAYYRSFNPAAGLLRELDAIAAVIIGGGSIFGGFGTVIGSLAGAAVITLIRSLLSLQIILADGSSFVLPQHWMNVFIGVILIAAVVGDIWIRQNGILRRLFPQRSASVIPKGAPA